jgi:hypothetical protein
MDTNCSTSVFEPHIPTFLSLIIYLIMHWISYSVHLSFIRSFSSAATLPFIHRCHSHIDLPVSSRTIPPSILHLRIFDYIHSVHFLFFTLLSSPTLPLTPTTDTSTACSLFSVLIYLKPIWILTFHLLLGVPNIRFQHICPPTLHII